MADTARRALVLDVETASESDLRKTGSRRYAADPSTKVTVYSFQLLDYAGPNKWVVSPLTPEPIEVIGDTCHKLIRESAGAGHLFVAHNCGFEIDIWQGVLATRAGWPVCPDPLYWRDTMALAAVSGLPLDLDGACVAAGLPNRKDKQGHALMMRMARPRTKDKQTGRALTWWHETDHLKVKELSAYCAQDVRSEVDLFRFRPGMHPTEQALWRATLRMNMRGIGIDHDLVDRMMTLAEQALGEYDAEAAKISGGAVTSLRSAVALRDWFDRKGHNLPDVQRATVERYLAGLVEKFPRMDEGRGRVVKRMLELRLLAAKSSVAKLKAMQAMSVDGVVHGLQVHYGANRTGRWAGRGIQVQNFPRPQRGLDVKLAVKLIKAGTDAAGIEMFVGHDIMTVLSSCLRACLVAPTDPHDTNYLNVFNGPKEPDWSDLLVVADYSAVEARVLPWLAGEQWVLDAFRAGRDVYVETANKLAASISLNIKIDRAFGKLMVLSCGYQTGWRKLQTTAADDYGIVLTDSEAQDAVAAWRAANPNIVRFWYQLNDAAIAAVRDGTANGGTGQWYSVGKVGFRMTAGHLYMRLPSGRTLVYRDAEITYDPQYNTDGVTFMGVDQYTRKWTRQRGYGGFWANNATQGSARDLLAETIEKVEASAQRVTGMLVPLMTVHDELVCVWRRARGTADRALKWLVKLMATPASWCPDLPLAAEGYVDVHFKKG